MYSIVVLILFIPNVYGFLGEELSLFCGPGGRDALQSTRLLSSWKSRRERGKWSCLINIYPLQVSVDNMTWKQECVHENCDLASSQLMEHHAIDFWLCLICQLNTLYAMQLYNL